MQCWISSLTSNDPWDMMCCFCQAKEHQQQQENHITNTQTNQTKPKYGKQQGHA